MRKTLRLTVLYREGSNPHDDDTEWREITIKSDRWPPAPSYSIEEFSGFEKKETNSDTATLLSGADFREVLQEWDKMLERLEKEGFRVYDPRTWPML
jgi:hypothetical protein